MADYTYASELFFDELLRISSDIVWKNPKAALENEVQNDLPYIERYILSRQGRLSFPLIDDFAEEVITSIGITDRQQIVACMSNREYIPENLRDLAVQRQMEYNIRTYVESNNYYRMLNGLPNKEDTEEDWVYNDRYREISNPDVPIHELNSSQLYKLEANGYLAYLQEQYPDKKYLHYLLDKKIDIYKARQSSPFSLLWVKESEYPSLSEDFVETYNECRYMIYSIFYQKILESSNEQYIGFIGMMILFQTIMQMHRKFLDTDITRDFYDEDSLRLVYDSYGVPFYKSIPLEYHKKIVKNINILISHKGSTKVFYDIFDIFGLDKTAVFEFYLLKIHKFKGGKPVFYYNEDGTPNIKEMYDIRFGKVELYNDPTTEMNQPKNQVSFEELTRKDPYWINDKDLLDSLYAKEFNYMDSKYLGIQTTFNLMKILYETTYYFKLIFDNRELLETTTIYNTYTHSSSRLFDLVVYICALVVKKYGYVGNIPTDIHSIGKVMGFNFQEDLIVLKRNISENDKLKNDSVLMNYLESMDVYSLESVSKVYTNLSDLRRYLVQKMADTDDVPTYMAYYELYQTIMYSEYTTEAFRKKDETTAISFSDMLQDCNTTLYNKLESVADDEIDDEISNTIYILKSSCSSLSLIQYADTGTVDVLMEYLFKLLEFFKSAKADLTGYEVVFSLVSSGENVIKLMNYIEKISDTYEAIYSQFDELTDEMHLIKDLIAIRDQYRLIDEMYLEWHSSVVQDTINYIDDKIKILKETVRTLVSKQEFIEDLIAREIIMPIPEELMMKDQVFLLWDEVKEVLRFYLEDEHLMLDVITYIKESLPRSLSEDEKITLIGKIAVAIFSESKRTVEYRLHDSMPSEEVIEFLNESKFIAEAIIVYYKNSYGISTDASMTDIINEFTETFIEPQLMGDISYKINFSDSFNRMNLFVELNSVTLLTNIVGESLDYFIWDDASLKETCKTFEHYDYIWKDSEHLEGFIVSEKEKKKIIDNSHLSDSIILRYEETFED